MSLKRKSNDWGRVQCPLCNRRVDVVDGEYARHYTGSELCVMSMREVEWRTHAVHRGVRFRLLRRAPSGAGRTDP